MSFSSILRSLFHRAPSQSGPGQGGRAHRPGQTLLDHLDELSRGRGATRDGVVMGSAMNALTVPRETLVQQDRRSRLDANWASPSVIVMSLPEHAGDAFDWARMCHEHRVTTVVDVGPPAGGARAWMADGTPLSAPAGGDSARFQVLGPPLSKNTMADGDLEFHTKVDGARERQVNLGWKPVGQEEVNRTLAWTRLPVNGGHAPDPDTLLLVCRRLQARASASSSPPVVAFQDANGGNTAAVFAAAMELLRQHVRQPLSRAGLDEAIARTCDDLRQGRCQTLFTGRPDLLGALKAYGERLIDAGPWQRTIEDHATMKPLPLEPSGPLPALIGEPASGLRGLLRRARAAGQLEASPARRVVFDGHSRTATFTYSAPVRDGLRFHVKRPFNDEPKPFPKRLPAADRKALARRDQPWDDQPAVGSDIASSR